MTCSHLRSHPKCRDSAESCRTLAVTGAPKCHRPRVRFGARRWSRAPELAGRGSCEVERSCSGVARFDEPTSHSQSNHKRGKAPTTGDSRSRRRARSDRWPHNHERIIVRHQIEWVSGRDAPLEGPAYLVQLYAACLWLGKRRCFRVCSLILLLSMRMSPPRPKLTSAGVRLPRLSWYRRWLSLTAIGPSWSCQMHSTPVALGDEPPINATSERAGGDHERCPSSRRRG